MVIGQDDVGRRILLKRLYINDVDNSQSTKWDGDWELFGIRYDGTLVVKQISSEKIIEIRYNPDLIKLVGPKMSGA